MCCILSSQFLFQPVETILRHSEPKGIFKNLKQVTFKDQTTFWYLNLQLQGEVCVNKKKNRSQGKWLLEGKVDTVDSLIEAKVS